MQSNAKSIFVPHASAKPRDARILSSILHRAYFRPQKIDFISFYLLLLLCWSIWIDSVRNGVVSWRVEIFLSYVFQLKRTARLSVPLNGYIGRPKHDSFSYGKTSQRYQITQNWENSIFYILSGYSMDYSPDFTTCETIKTYYVIKFKF